MTPTELKAFLKDELGENRPSALEEISRIVDSNPEDYCLKLLEDARKLYGAKVKTADDSRVRTLGGCFFFVYRYRQKGKL